jgi:cytochrome c oxidase cbb3-type subunit 3
MTSETQAPPETRRDPLEDRLMDHEYDGIREYDNPLPRWWLTLFYGCIAFSVLYFVNVPGIGVGKGRIASYEAEMAKARAQAEALAQQRPRLEVSDASLIAASQDPGVLARGRETFSISCAPCHRVDGGGNIGPNLTDDYWLHGARPIEVHKTISGGVAEKGMPAWSTMLAPDRVFDVAAFVLTLHGTHPANPKPPQGVEVEAGEREPHGDAAPTAPSGHSTHS